MSGPGESSPGAAFSLVLGGGGTAAVGWELGVLRGLAAAGLDLARADAIVGTSAGAVVGCRLTAGACIDVESWAEAARNQRPVDVDFPALMRRLADLGSGAADPRSARRRIGEWALAAATGSGRERLAEIASLIGRTEWPDADLTVTAVDAWSGDLVTFTRHTGVPLVAAVAASCAVPGVWPPVQIRDRFFIDGAVRSAVNASVAAGSRAMLVLAPQAGPGGLDRELGRLSVDTHVEAMTPDDDSLRAFGSNPLDPATGPASAAAGLRQGRAAADVVARLLGQWPAGAVPGAEDRMEQAP